MNNIYIKLAAHLDELPEGFPRTESGVELKILKKLFTPEEAEIALALRMMLETPEPIATRLSMNENKLVPILESMSKKGLIFRVSKNRENFYMASQFVIGIWEYHVNDLDRELISYFNEYVPFLSKKIWNSHKTKQLRIIPIPGSISIEAHIMPYEEATKIIESQTKIVIAPCICRKEHNMMGKGCGYMIEACFVFGKGAEYYKENGLGRFINHAEAIYILKKGISSGLVLQVGNSKKPLNICMCCSCCCQILKNIKTQEFPSQIVNSGWYAEVDESLCVSCGICIERCHLDAVALYDDIVSVNRDRCIGCGVCILGCEVEAIKLLEKEPGERWIPPKNTFETYFNIAKERKLIE